MPGLIVVNSSVGTNPKKQETTICSSRCGNTKCVARTCRPCARGMERIALLSEKELLDIDIQSLMPLVFHHPYDGTRARKKEEMLCWTLFRENPFILPAADIDTFVIFMILSLSSTSSTIILLLIHFPVDIVLHRP